MSQNPPLNELEVGDRITDAVLRVASMTELKTKNEDPYLKLELGDETGTMVAMVWQRSRPSQPATAALISAVVEDYRGAKQLKILGATQFLGRDELSDEVAGKLGLPPSARSLCESMRLKLMHLPDKWTKLLVNVMDNTGATMGVGPWLDPRHPYWHVPAATSYHHAFEGGLAVHTLSMLSIAESLEKGWQHTYPSSPDWALLKAAIVLHDAGKIATYEETEQGWQHTAAEKMLGHIGVALLQIAGRSMLCLGDDGISMQELVGLVHCVLAHHGRPEWGALREPTTPEAHLIHHIDMIDSRLEPALRSLA